MDDSPAIAALEQWLKDHGIWLTLTIGGEMSDAHLKQSHSVGEWFDSSFRTRLRPAVLATELRPLLWPIVEPEWKVNPRRLIKVTDLEYSGPPESRRLTILRK